MGDTSSTGDGWAQWFQNLVSTGLSAKWDSEYLQPYQTVDGVQYVRDANGNLVPQGAPVATTTAQANHNLLLIGGVIVGGALLFMVLKD